MTLSDILCNDGNRATDGSFLGNYSNNVIHDFSARER